jgi:hypothetical protein
MRVVRLAAVAVVVATMAACGQSGSPPVPSQTPAKTVFPVLGRTYAAAAPPDRSSGGGAMPRSAPCYAVSTRMSAVTAANEFGVLGVITLTKAGCTLEVDATHLRLLTADGKRVDVTPSAGNPTNPAASKRPDIAEYAGEVRIGFAWTGSYCGPVAAKVQLPVNGHPTTIALHGPAPHCDENGHSQLVPGTVNGLKSPVEPAPAAWSALRARVMLPARVPRSPIPLTVVLSNASRSDISLAGPCPYYNTTTSLFSHGYESLILGGGGDLCGKAFVVPAGKSLTLHLGTLPFPEYSDLPRTLVRTGDPVMVTWEMAGVPTARARASIE